MSSERKHDNCLLKESRQGNVVVFAVFLMVSLMAILALAVDLGYLATVSAEAQRTADAGALAGAAALYHLGADLESAAYYLSPNPTQARQEARRFVRNNRTGGRSVDIGLNTENYPSGDIVIGRLNRPADHTDVFETSSDTPNTVQVRVPLLRDHSNGPAALFFGRIFGLASVDVSASATATVWYPAALPFATSVENWESLADGGAGDNFAYQPGQGDFGVVPGFDGVAEIVMFPGPWSEDDLPPGNFGVIQIGPDGLVLDTLRRQIDMGPSVTDLSYHDGVVYSGDQLSGRTGLKSATKHAFLGGWTDGRSYAGMIGRPRQLPIYESAKGNGDNAVFTISRFAAVRVLAIRIDGHWRTDYEDTEGDEIEAITVQPLTSIEDLVQLQLTR
jgi:hypothetical protein